MKVIDKLSQVEDPRIDPRKLQFRLKRGLRERIESALKSKTDSSERQKDKDDLKKLMDEDDESNKQLLSYEQVEKVYKLLQRLDHSYFVYFFEFLDECSALVPDGRANKELDDRLKKLQFEESKKAYERMSGSILMSGKSGSLSLGEFSSDIKSIKKNLIAIFNSALVIAGSFAFVYKATEYSLPQPDIVVQVLAALIAAIVVAIAELYFLAKIM